MTKVSITRDDFLKDRQGRTFADVLDLPDQAFQQVLEFFDNEDRQRRMMEAELHHDRAPLAGVVRELESNPFLDQFLAGMDARRNQRLRQAIGVLVRMIMERHGWEKTGKKGSLGVRAEPSPQLPSHNQGGLAIWFVRAERYRLPDGMPFQSVSQRRKELEARAQNTSVSSN